MKGKTGAYEWAGTMVNITTGCGNGGCRYCYAREMANRFGWCKYKDWNKPIIRKKEVDKKRPLYKKQPVFFQNTSDITQENLLECIFVLEKLLAAGNQVLIVSKPRFKCVMAMCDALKEYKDQIVFRFTIGSMYNDVLKFWEPNAPNFTERISCLRYAYTCGFSTSVSCEPFLDKYVLNLFEICSEFITESFWIGRMRNIKQRLDLTGATEKQKRKYVDELLRYKNRSFIELIYINLKDQPLVRWKDSIRAILGSK